MAQAISELKQRIREANDAELSEMLQEYKEELFNLRFQEANRELPNVKRIWFVRKAIARIRTEQRARRMAA